MSKASNKDQKTKVNSKLILGIVAVVVIIAIIVIVVVVNSGKSDEGKSVSTDLDTEIWLNENESATLKNGDDEIKLRIDSDLNYTDGEEFEVPYVLVVNDIEYSGTYTFATGYSIHSEPNNIPYKVSFTGIQQGSVGVKVSAKE